MEALKTSLECPICRTMTNKMTLRKVALVDSGNLVSLKDNVEAIVKTVPSLRAERDAARQECEKMRGELEESKKETEKLRQECKRLQADYDELHAAIKKIKMANKDIEDMINKEQ